MRQLISNRNFWVMIVGDMLLVGLAYYAAHLIRFEGVVPMSQMRLLAVTIGWIVPVYAGCFYGFDLYKGMWRYTSLQDLVNLFLACLIGSAVVILAVLVFYRFQGFSRSVLIIHAVLCLLLVGGFRVAVRLTYAWPLHGWRSMRFGSRAALLKRILIIGAGSCAEKLIRDIGENRQLNYDLVGLLDDKPAKQHQRLHGVPVVGTVDQLAEVAAGEKIDEILIAVPSATNQQMRRIVEACKACGVTYKTVPGLIELIQGNVSVSTVRQVEYQDLLSREPVCLENDLICGFLTGRRVLVTGGAGSIGSELCRQIARFGPRSLIIVERNESGLYEFALDLKAEFPELEVISALGAVQNRDCMDRVFRVYQPQVVFHAAAYKHVPMMELHPWEAIFNNVVGSRTVLDLCHAYQVERCVVVSTDKAVRPTNVMGATKRLVEMLTQGYAALNGVRFMAVRFGNVLGSVGSVVPLFKKQIAAGGPVTVTDPQVTRYFMTIPEACSLILQSGAIGRGGEIFVLKMGTPVRIADMARDMISLSGFTPGEDIQIQYTGLRPGEKLFEELITQGEGIQHTQHDDIMVLAAECVYTLDQLTDLVDQLVDLAKTGDDGAIRAQLCRILPDYCPEKACAGQSAAMVGADSGADAAQPAAVAGRPVGVVHGPLVQGLDGGLDPDYGEWMGLTTTDRLLLGILADQPAGPQAVQVDGLSATEWQKIIQRANAHRVTPLLYRRLKQSERIAILPPNSASAIQQVYLHYTKKNILACHRLAQAVRLLKAADIPVIVLKDAFLADAVYRNVGVRPIAQLDLLVHPSDGPRAELLLAESGLHGAGPLNIALHTGLGMSAVGSTAAMEGVWARAQSVIVGGEQVLGVSTADALILLCMELAFGHHFKQTGVRTLCDIRQLILRYQAQLDWDALVILSDAYGARNAVMLTLMLARQLLQVSTPPAQIRSTEGEEGVFRLRSWAVATMFEARIDMDNYSPHFWEIWQPGSTWSKLRAVVRMLLPAPAEVIRQYGLSGRPLAMPWGYALRFKDNFAKYFSALVRIVFRDKTMLKLIQEQRDSRMLRDWLAGK